MLGTIGILLLAYFVIVLFSVLSEISYKKRPVNEVLKKEEIFQITKKASLGFVVLLIATIVFQFVKNKN